jgi:hypothetical protein
MTAPFLDTGSIPRQAHEEAHGALSSLGHDSRLIAPIYASGRGRRRDPKRTQRLMRLIGIAALGPKPRTSKPAPGHKIYPYILRDVTIERANHVWVADISVPQQAA